MADARDWLPAWRRSFSRARHRLRDELRAAGWQVRDGAAAPSSYPGRDRLGLNAVREALRGPRSVRTAWATKGAARSSRGAIPANADQIAARAGSDGDQGVCPTSRSTATPRGRAPAAADPAPGALDQVRTRGTWARSAAPPSARARPA